MATHGSRPVRSRMRPGAIGLWLAMLLVGLGGSPPPEKGSGCAGRQDAEADAKRGLEQDASPVDERATRHPAFAERTEEREHMVADQIEAREVHDPNVLRAMRVVPRHAFIPESQRPYAYEDRALPIGQDQTISQPYIVALMTETLALEPNSVVLEIGTGSGYQAAVCAEIAREVYSVEIIESLVASAAQTLSKLGYVDVHVKAGDGYFGWSEKGPFDAIIGTAAARDVPAPLIQQLKPRGRMILPVDSEFGFQHLILVTKDPQGQLHYKKILPVRFVPMTGRIQQPQ